MINLFFADVHRRRAVGVLLSGKGVEGGKKQQERKETSHGGCFCSGLKFHLLNERSTENRLATGQILTAFEKTVFQRPGEVSFAFRHRTNFSAKVCL
jgi:hypothetical protein